MPGLYPAAAVMQGPAAANWRKKARRMKRPDTRAYANTSRQWAMIFVIFPVVTLSGHSPVATLHNLSVVVGATTYRIPRLIPAPDH